MFTPHPIFSSSSSCSQHQSYPLQPLHASLHQAEGQWGDSEAEMSPKDQISQILVSFPSLLAYAAPEEPAGWGCRRQLALTCVQGDVGRVNHLKFQAGEENSPLGKNKRRWGMSRRVAEVRLQLPNPGTPGWVLSVQSSQKLPCRRGARERADPAPFPAGFGISRDPCRVKRGKGSCG